jgi:1-acyl-sn-glycerol-3-phosphate acyltransferase
VTILRTARLAYRLFFLSLWTLAVYAVWQPGMWILQPWPVRQLRWRVFVFRTWSQRFAKLLRMRIVVRGQPPAPPFLLVTNHLSYIDIILLASQLGCTFISRHDLAGWPVIGHLTTKMGTIYIDRNARKDVMRVSEEIAASLRCRALRRGHQHLRRAGDAFEALPA